MENSKPFLGYNAFLYGLVFTYYDMVILVLAVVL